MNDVLIEAEALQNLLLAYATGRGGDNAEYLRLRQVLLAQPSLEFLLPRFIRTCRSLDQFWAFIKKKFPTYAERTAYLSEEMNPFLEALEKGGGAPSDSLVSGAIEKFDAANVQATWSKALDRRASDAEGAITVARTLLESVCKHILDESTGTHDDTLDITKLYKQAAEQLNIAPSQHTELVFKQILGGCTSVVEGLGALRNRLSDSHGKGKLAVKPSSRHAELAVNLAGAMATFLLATWEARNESTP